MKKVCHVIFSTNRLNYLTQTLESQKNNLNFDGVHVHRLFIDDYPRGRDNYQVGNLALSYGFDEIYLHKENIGLTSTWHELFVKLRNRDFDYILHQEDDVVFKEPMNVAEWIEILESNPQLSQVQLKRNNWYDYETEGDVVKETDIKVKGGKYYIETGTPWFWMLMTLYPAWIAKIDFVKETGYCPAERVVADYLLQKHNIRTGILKNSVGSSIVEHIGEISKGKRVNPNEPSWEKFWMYDSNKLYNSRTGALIED